MNDLKALKLGRMKAREYQDEAERNRLWVAVPRQGPRWLLARSLVQVARWLSPTLETPSARPQPAPRRRVRS